MTLVTSASTTEAASLRESSRSRGKLGPSGMRIVLADDHPLVRKAIGDVASSIGDGTEVVEVGSLGELLAHLRRGEDTDMILLDLHLPDCSAFAGIRTLREKYPATPVIVVSANTDAQTVNRAIELGASAFVPKSSSLSEIRAAIIAVFAGDIWLPPRPATSAQPAQGDLLGSLTPAQAKIVACLNRGLANKQIAYELGVTEYTVKAHMTAAFKKLGVTNRTQAMLMLKNLEGAA